MSADTALGLLGVIARASVVLLFLVPFIVARMLKHGVLIGGDVDLDAEDDR